MTVHQSLIDLSECLIFIINLKSLIFDTFLYDLLVNQTHNVVVVLKTIYTDFFYKFLIGANQ